MTFSSYNYIFAFLPITVSLYWGLLYFDYKKAAFSLVIASTMLFYWLLDGNNLAIIILVVIANYLFSFGIATLNGSSKKNALYVLYAGIVFNVLSFLYLKDFAFTQYTSNALIPIGISFIIVQQVVFLIYSYETSAAVVEPHQFGFFALSFPYIIAGPIVRREEMFGQYASLSWEACKVRFLPAVTLFAIGLFKKVVIADNLGTYVDQIYDTALAGEPITVIEAWYGAILYTFQVYFDFSGYTDMAIASGGFLGLSLPRNFHSPLKKTNIIEFWRTWHRSMTRFFVDFVFVPLAVKMTRFTITKRIKPPISLILRMFLPLLATFLVVGVWHGAGANFIAFAVIMGVALAICQIWRIMGAFELPATAAWFCTILIILFTLVLDRSADFSSAKLIWSAMIGLEAGTSSQLDVSAASVWVVGLSAFILLLPNSNELLAETPLILRDSWDSDETWNAPFRWKPNLQGVVFSASILAFSILSLTKAEDFIYYRF